MRRSILGSAALAGLLSLAAMQAQAARYRIVDRIAGPDGGWDYATFDPHARRIYVAREAEIMALDIDSGKVIPKITEAVHPHSPLPLPGGELLVTNGGSDTAVFVDAVSGKVLASVITGKGPDAAIFDAKSGLAFVMNHESGDVTFIDVAKRTALATVPVGQALEFAAVDGQGRLWVNDNKTSEIISIDIVSRKVIGRHKLEGCEGPTGLAYAPAAHRLVATCDDVAAVVDPRTGSTVDRLKIGKGPDAAFYDPVRKRLLVTAGESGELDVIDASEPKMKVLQVVKTAPGARTGTVDPKTGKVYLPMAKMGPPPPGDPYPEALPGTFKLLVVSP